jgi:hypothetical protein
MARGASHTVDLDNAADKEREKRVVEMDGGRGGPFDRGTCTSLLEV